MYINFIPIIIKVAILIGTSVGAGWLGLSSYTTHILNNYSIVVPEVEGKYQYVQDNGWKDMDSIVSFANDNNLKVHYHTLIWWTSIPSDPCKWITEAMQRYPTIKDWDVLNEGWSEYGPTSTVDVVEIYKCAREARPDARLWYSGVFSSKLERDMAVWLLESSLADGVGIQFHVGLGWDLSERLLAVKAFESTGRPWRISELDVRILLPPTTEDLALQKRMYDDISYLCINSRTCTNITIWGASDKESWIQWQYDGYGYATPFDYYYNPKEFWFSMK